GAAPAQSLIPGVVEMTLPPAHFRAWLPAYPIRMFAILPPERQETYLTRFLSRGAPPEAFLLRDPEQMGSEAVIDRGLARFYRRTDAQRGGESYRFERYDRR